jgi:hypothetical protein
MEASMSCIRNLLFFLLVGMLVPASLHSADRDDVIKEALSVSPYDPIHSAELLQSLIRQYPDWDYPYLVLADIYDRNAVISESIRCFEKGLVLNSQLPEFMHFKVLYRLGDLHARLGHLTNALQYFRKASVLKPDDKQLKNSLDALVAWIKAVSISNTSERIEALDRVLQKRPGWIVCDLELAQSLMKEGSFYPARKEYETALSYTPVYSICVPGTYKGGSWNPGLNPMKYQGDGKWEVTLPLVQGTNEYKFVINQKITISDIQNTNTSGPLVNSLVIGNYDGEPRVFRYRTLPLDPVFIRILEDLDTLRTSSVAYFIGNFQKTAATDDPVEHVFTVTNPMPVRELFLAGSFNGFLTNWKDRTNWAMNRSESNVWTARVSLKPGKYLYETVANTRARFIDWNADDFYVDENGHGNVFAAVAIGGSNLNRNVLRPLSLRYKPQEKSVSSVHVAGSFNYWGGTACAQQSQISNYGFPMTGPDADGYFTLNAHLPAGRMQYKYVVNGGIWHSDPENENSENDGWGGDNSVLIIGGGDSREMRSNIQLRNVNRKIRFTLDFNRFPKILRVSKSGDIILLPPENTTVKRFKNDGWSPTNSLFVNEMIGFYPNKTATIQWIRTETPPVTPDLPVVLRFQKTNIRSVFVIGDFNGWSVGKDFMQGPSDDGNWSYQTNLPSGIYRYRFVAESLNGRRDWISDPENLATASDGMGGVDSVLYSGIGNNRFANDLRKTEDMEDARFRFYAPKARSVEVSGNFNDWSFPAFPLHGPDQNGFWETNFPLPKNAWQYKFILDGETWVADPSNQLMFIDSLGNMNSVIRVMDDSERASLQKVRFRFRAPSARLIDLEGDFYSGEFVHIRMQGPDAEGWWETTLDLNKGNYLYRFNVIEKNGTIHIETDPLNRYYATDGIGSMYSVISVGLTETERARINALSEFPQDLRVLGVFLLTQESDSRLLERLKFYSLSKFQAWKDIVPMLPTGKPGVYETEIETESRRVLYNYLIVTSYNGNLYLVDPDADDFSPNGSGGFHFVKFGDRSD